MKTTVCTAHVRLMAGICVLGGLLTPAVHADSTPQALPFLQNWTDVGLITQDNDWSKVPGFMGYRGDKLASKPGANPQTITADGGNTPVSVLANQSRPQTLRTGGIAEFDGVPNPVIALKGSATASAPFLLLNLTTKGRKNIAFGYKLRDVDSSPNNAVQALAFQYRVGTNTDFIDLPEAFTPDASTGPNLATLVTPIIVRLPAETDDQPLVQVRWITANAEGNDEWIGISAIAAVGNEIEITAPAPSPPPPAGPETKEPKETNAAAKPVRAPRDLRNP